MTSGEYAVILVHSTSHAIRAERILQKAGILSKMIPVPRHLSSDCGVSIRVARAGREAASQALEAAGVEIDVVHDV
jgi:ribosomal protein S11